MHLLNYFNINLVIIYLFLYLIIYLLYTFLVLSYCLTYHVDLCVNLLKTNRNRSTGVD